MNLTKFFQNGSNLRLAGVGAGVLVFAALSKLLWLAALGTIGAVAFGVGSLVLIGLWKLVPYFLQKLDNEVLELRKKEARANPIAQRQNTYKRNDEIIALRTQQLEEINTQARNMRSMLEKRRQTNPTEDMGTMWKDLTALENMVIARAANIRTMKEVQKKNWKDLEAQSFRYTVGTKSSQIKDLIAKTEGDTTTNRLLDAEADDAINDSYNRSFAELDVEFLTNMDSLNHATVQMGMAEEVRTQEALANDPSPALPTSSQTQDRASKVYR